MQTEAQKIAATLEKLKAAPMPSDERKRAAIATSLARMAELIATLEPIQAI